MDKHLLTFEECLDYIEKETGCKYLDWQKEFFRTIYDYPELYITPTRQDGIIPLYEAQITLDKLLGVNEMEFSTTMDCNNCEHLNMTEAEQNAIEHGAYIPHICKKYNRRVLHHTTSIIHNEHIYPCDECLKENNNEQ